MHEAMNWASAWIGRANITTIEKILTTVKAIHTAETIYYVKVE